MAIRFILGRAGSGKTHHCLTAVREQLRHDPINGPRLILLVPEQAALQMERAVLDSKDITAAHRVEVLSFRRLAFRVLASVGSSARRALSEPARAMVLRHLVAKRSDQLKYYRRADRLGGFVTQLSATITELIQEAVTPDSLGSTMEPGADIEPMQRAKLHDIREIYEAYLDYLGTDRVDPSQHLEIARGLLPRCDWIRGAEVWVDGFASLARQETLTLISLARLCRSMEITGLVDPSLSEPGNSVTASGSASLFHKTHQTYIDLCRQFAAAGLEIQDPLLFGHKTPPRFKAGTPLARLERSIFLVESSEPQALARANLCSSAHTQDAREIAQTEVCGSRLASQDIELAELPSRRIEVEYAVARICQWVEDPTTQYRYRDIAIIARDLDPYHDLLTQALGARDIPFFIDRRRGIAHHPLPEFLRASVLLAATNWSLESVRIILKTGLLPVSVKEADELENYLLAYALSGYETWCEADWSFVARRTFTQSDPEPDPNETARLVRINQTRRQLVTLIEPWMRFALDAGGHTGTEWAAAIMNWLESAGVGRKVEAWVAQAEQDGDLDLAAEHRQVWRDCLSFVDDVGFALGDERLTADELGHVFEAGLSSLTLGLAPPMVDQILVGSIERSRHPDLKAVVVIGFNDGLFPQRPMEDAILNDDDRAFLRDRGVEIRPPSRDRIFDEPLLVYIAVTRPSDRLLITTAATDAEGKALHPSPYLDELERVCPGLCPTKVADPVVSRDTWDILTARDLTRRIVAEMRTRGPAAQDDEGVRARWNGLYDSVRDTLLEASGARYALSSLSERPQATISPATLERLHHGTMLMSVSQLESYAACPFQHFSNSVLKLSERAEAPLARVVGPSVWDEIRPLLPRRIRHRGLVE
ncbi:MAG: PD-(D/E)XK nuclease family protein [Planctomycetes bacterium]|nr:PD-(D/E)XK nuclease family protein [Planctomycetota bacterium]